SESFVDLEMDRVRFIVSIVFQHSGLYAGQNLNTIVNRAYRVDVEPSLLDSFYHLFAQHEMLDIAPWNEDSLVTLQAFGLACMIESLNLLVYSSYCLNLSLLVYRSGDREVLLDRKFGEGGENRIELGAGRTVTLHSAIALLKDKSTRDAQGLVTSILVL